jgi:curved DNA-binding protein CbpA
MSLDTIERAHRTLGLRVFASPEEIKKAWRVRANETHPDHGGNAKAFRDVQAAADVLLAEGAREFYQAESRRTAAAQRAPSYATSGTSARPTSYAAPPPTAKRTSTIADSARPRPRVHRRPALLVAAIFGFVIAPHLRELGLSWDPLPFHDFCEVMQSFDWVFFAAWLWLRKPVTT